MSATHTGQQPSNHVTLETIHVANTGDPKQDLDFIRINQDGTRPAAPTNVVASPASKLPLSGRTSMNV